MGHITVTIHIIMDITTPIITDTTGTEREVLKKNLKTMNMWTNNMCLKEVQIPHPHQMPHLKPHLKLMLTPQLGIMPITDTTHIIHMDITTPITGTDEDKKFGKKFFKQQFFFSLSTTATMKNSSNMDLTSN